MKQLSSIIFSMLFLFLLTSCENKKTPSEIHSDLLTIDTHIDIPIKLTRDSTYNISDRHTYEEAKTRTDLPRMSDGGLDAAVFVVWTAQGERNETGNKKAKEQALKIIKAINKNISNAENAKLAFSSSDVYKINNEKKHPILIGMENGYPIGDSIKLVEEFYNLGIRYITLCHTGDNDICDSSTGEEEDEGLSEFGAEVVKEMNRLGIIVDVSHISDSSFYQVMRITKVPAIASHSNARALCDHPRNMTDDMIKLLAKNGGVIQVNFYTGYLKLPGENPARDSAIAIMKGKYDFANMSKEERKAFHKEMNAITEKYPIEYATIDDVINQIDYIVKLVGIDHVGIGSDFDGGGGIEGLRDVSEMGNITSELLKRGYSIEDIQKIWSGNFLRVFKAVEDYAKNTNN